jgi:endo-1,4-beta-xylanase
MDRRQFLMTATGAALASCSTLYKNDTFIGTQNNSAAIAATTSLKDAARRANKFYGCAISEQNIERDPAYAKLIKNECSIATTEGAFKWAAIEPVPGQFNFTMADKTLNFCAANNIKLRGHTLIWHMARPDWLAYPPKLSDVERHFTAILRRYRNNRTLYSWDIVNEVIADNPSEAEDQVYGLRKGVKPEYIRDVFQMAAKLDRSKEFVINDYGCEDVGWKQDKYLNFVKYLKKSNVKLDAVGLQAHMWFSKNYAWNATGFRTFLKKLKDAGVKPIVTELDVIIDTPIPNTIAELDIMVADGYKRFLGACFAEGVDTIVTWGLADKYSWLRHPDYIPQKLAAYKDFIRPLPYDENLQPKLARNAILQSFKL